MATRDRGPERLSPVKEQLHQLGQQNATVRRCFDLHRYQRVEYTEMLELLVLALAQQNAQMEETLVQQAFREKAHQISWPKP